MWFLGDGGKPSKGLVTGYPCFVAPLQGAVFVWFSRDGRWPIAMLYDPVGVWCRDGNNQGCQNGYKLFLYSEFNNIWASRYALKGQNNKAQGCARARAQPCANITAIFHPEGVRQKPALEISV